MSALRQRLRLVYPVLICLLMAVIFRYSAQPAGSSTAQSSRICRTAAPYVFLGYAQASPDVQEELALSLTYVVRKGAHFAEYALLGALWYLWLRRRRFGWCVSIGASAGYAVTDEVHQLFVPGRAGMAADVLLDSAGAVCGVAGVFVLLCVLHCLRCRSAQEKGVWKL